MSKKDKGNAPIGVFDSGLGGLTVVKELMRCLPKEDIVYFGDTARVPYGTKSKESIVRFSNENAWILKRNNVKVIVVACNSSSGYAIEALKRNFSIPIVGVITPGARRAVSLTRNKRVGVVATSATVKSGAYEKRIKKFKRSIKVFQQECPLFVPLVEEGWIKSKITVDVTKEYLRGLQEKRVDTLILGCTHYPLLKTTIQKVMGKKVILVDSAREVAQEVKKTLKTEDLVSTQRRKARYKFLISDKPQRFQSIAKKFLGKQRSFQLELCRV